MFKFIKNIFRKRKIGETIPVPWLEKLDEYERRTEIIPKKTRVETPQTPLPSNPPLERIHPENTLEKYIADLYTINLKKFNGLIYHNESELYDDIIEFVRFNYEKRSSKDLKNLSNQEAVRLRNQVISDMGKLRIGIDGEFYNIGEEVISEIVNKNIKSRRPAYTPRPHYSSSPHSTTPPRNQPSYSDI